MKEFNLKNYIFRSKKSQIKMVYEGQLYNFREIINNIILWRCVNRKFTEAIKTMEEMILISFNLTIMSL